MPTRKKHLTANWPCREVPRQMLWTVALATGLCENTSRAFEAQMGASRPFHDECTGGSAYDADRLPGRGYSGTSNQACTAKRKDHICYSLVGLEASSIFLRCSVVPVVSQLLMDLSRGFPLVFPGPCFSNERREAKGKGFLVFATRIAVDRRCRCLHLTQLTSNCCTSDDHAEYAKHVHASE